MGWETKTLADVAYTAGRIGWKGLTAKEYTEAGPYFLSVHSLNYGDFVDFRDAFHISDERYDESPEIMLKPNDILICKDGAGIGKLGIVKSIPGPTTVNSSLLLIRALDDIDAKFLYYKLCSPAFQRIVQERIEGATTPHLYQREIKQFFISFPRLLEQKRIVTILDAALADIEQARFRTERNLKNARELFESYLQQVFSQCGAEVKQVSLSEITESISDGDHSAPPKSESGVPFITISNINKSTNQVDFSNTFSVPEEYFANLKPTRKPIVGDVLYTVTGSYGIPVLVSEEKDFCFQRHIGLVRPPNEGVDSKWLYYLLMSPQVFNQADSGATGTAQKTVSLKLLRGISVPNIPLGIQKEMVEGLDFMYEKSKSLEQVYNSKLKSLDELKKSILQKAFSGELTKDSKGVAA